jgi:hypothetical protein
MAYLLLIIFFGGITSLMVGGETYTLATGILRKLEGVLLMSIGVLGILAPIYYLATMH